MLPSSFPLRAASGSEIISSPNAPRSANIVLQANGGKVEQINPVADPKFAPNINDGYSTEWRAAAKQWPQDIVFSFYGGRTATLDRVVIDTLTKDTGRQPDQVPREVEIAVGLTMQDAAFKKVAGAELHKKAGRQMVTFFPAAARFLRVRFKSTYGAPVQFGEIEAYEEPGQPSVLEGRPLNIAAAGNGGAVALFTEPANDAAWLLDGQNRGWHTDSATRKADLVFAFRGDREALIERVVLAPKSNHATNTMARRGKILISLKTPLEGFEEAGEFQIEREGQEVEIPIGRRARFVKVAITENHGGKNTSLGEVKIIEGTEAGYQSVLAGPEGAASATNLTTIEGDAEAEPNNTADQAGLLFLESPLGGQIKPLGDEDFFTLEIEKPKFPEVSIELQGRPYIRTSLTLHQDGREIARFDPTNSEGQSAILKFPVTNGSYGLRVFEPPTSLLIVYDASSSMTKSMTNLRTAVEGFVDNLRPSVLVNLIRFDTKQEVLLPEFTSEQPKLKEAVAAKFQVGKGTALFDAVDAGTKLLEKVSGNRAMIVMTDGSDSASKTSYPNFWKLVEARKVRLYTVGFGNEMDLLADKLGTTPRRMMEHVALATHSQSYMSETAEELKNLYEAIGDEMRQVSGYSLLAFWGEQPPSLEAQVASLARNKGGATRRSGMRYFLFALGGLVMVGVIVGVVIAARGGGSGSKTKYIPKNRSQM